MCRVGCSVDQEQLKIKIKINQLSLRSSKNPNFMLSTVLLLTAAAADFFDEVQAPEKKTKNESKSLRVITLFCTSSKPYLSAFLANFSSESMVSCDLMCHVSDKYAFLW